MNYYYKHFLSLLLMAFIDTAANAQLSTPPGGGSQKSFIKQHIGGVGWVAIEYSSPAVRERTIFGGIVPYGFNNLGFGLSTADNPSPWRAGADENTTFSFSHDVLIEGQKLAAGKYGFFVAPQRTGDWTIIFSKDNNHWGSFYYQEENDALRVQVQPEKVAPQEWLTYEFIDRQNSSTTAALIWAETMVQFNIELEDPNGAHMAQIESELNNQTGFSYQNWSNAAIYASGIGEHAKAIEWAEAAVSAPFIGQKNWNTLSTKGAILTAAGNTEEASKVMDEAIKLPGANALNIHQYGRQLIASGQADKALKVFQFNYKQNQGVWPTNYGLARGYSALGDYKKALKYLELARKNVPAGDSLNPPVIDQNIEKLKKGEDIN